MSTSHHLLESVTALHLSYPLFFPSIPAHTFKKRHVYKAHSETEKNPKDAGILKYNCDNNKAVGAV